MDPNDIFFILLLLLFLGLAIANLVLLIRKIWKSNFYEWLKLLVSLLLVGFLILGVRYFVNGNLAFGTITLIYTSLIIGLNWSLSLFRKYSTKIRKERKRWFIIISTIIFAVFLPAILYLLATWFDKIDFIQSE